MHTGTQNYDGEYNTKKQNYDEGYNTETQTRFKKTKTITLSQT